MHLIDETPIELIWRFGLQSGRHVDRLAGLTFLAGATGCPLLADAVAWLDCREESRIDSGDRLIKEVTEAEPDRLGKLNRQVPPDLEMIVHKAIDKDPARRVCLGGGAGRGSAAVHRR